MSENCLFCKIAAKQIPSTILHEDELVVAFRDISPQAPTHVLIVPKVHVSGLNDLKPEHAPVVGRIMTVAAALAAQLGVSESGWRLVANCGPDAGQTVFHLHFHLLGGRGLEGRMG